MDPAGPDAAVFDQLTASDPGAAEGVQEPPNGGAVDAGPAEVPDAAAEAPFDQSAPPPDGPAPPADGPTPLFLYDFETGDQGWKDVRANFYEVSDLPVLSSTARAHRGGASLEMALTIADESIRPTFGIIADQVMKDRLVAGVKIRHWVWFPAGTRLIGVQGFIYYNQRGVVEPRWEGDTIDTRDLTPDSWNPIDTQVPADLDRGAGGVIDLGIEWSFSGPQPTAMKVYVDDVTITPP